MFVTLMTAVQCVLYYSSPAHITRMCYSPPLQTS